VPALITDTGGDQAGWRYVKFFAANINNDHTRRACARASARFFTWCDQLMFGFRAGAIETSLTKSAPERAVQRQLRNELRQCRQLLQAFHEAVAVML